jgi:hypothetical protein
MKRADILSEIKRVAELNGGKAPGSGSFANLTGIKVSDWRGVHWARWSDALVEAGLGVNEFNKANDPAQMLTAFLGYVSELSRLPTDAEMKLIRRTCEGFPHANVLRKRFGSKQQLAKKALEFGKEKGFREGVLDILAKAVVGEAADKEVAETIEKDGADGFVYLMKSGKHYKIGKTNSLDRRQYQIGLELPVKIDPIHSIRTDDPSGIEAYWHNRFRDKRLNGEWFELSMDDVRKFKRRKSFM